MPFLLDLIIILALSTLVNLSFTKLKLPVVIGYLLTGLLAGQYGFGLLNQPEEINHLAEIGVILLLFAIGIEFSVSKLLAIKRIIVIGGSIQVLATIGFVYYISKALGFASNQSIFFGFMVALSSTAVVLKILQEQSKLTSAYGKITLGILIFQDLIAIPMMFAIPLLSNTDAMNINDIAILLGKLIALCLFLFVSHKYIIPKLLYFSAKTDNQEIFLFSIILIALSIAYVTYKLGLSLAFGAFLAGLIISETEYKHHAFSRISPFRDLFTSFFFVSIGMMLNVEFIAHNWYAIAIAVIGIQIIKMTTGYFSSQMLGYPMRTNLLVAFALCQIGEFSFLLITLGIKHSLITDYHLHFFLTIAAATMTISPMVIMSSNAIIPLVDKLPLPRFIKNGLMHKRQAEFPHLDNHTIIIGMGLHGHHLAKTFTMNGIPFIIIDTNAETVRQEQKRGLPIIYGDACHANVLKHAKIEQAAVLVLALSNPLKSLQITKNARSLNPAATIIVKAENIEDIEEQYHAGASKVIPQELEISINIFASVLSNYLIPKAEINEMVIDLRKDGYQLLIDEDNPNEQNPHHYHLNLPNIKVSTVKVQENSYAQGKSIGQLAFRSKYSVSIIGMQTDKKFIVSPPSSILVGHGDILYLMGTSKSIAPLVPFFIDKSSVLLS